jgi:hypothetical protein
MPERKENAKLAPHSQRSSCTRANFPLRSRVNDGNEGLVAFCPYCGDQTDNLVCGKSDCAELEKQEQSRNLIAVSSESQPQSPVPAPQASMSSLHLGSASQIDLDDFVSDRANHWSKVDATAATSKHILDLVKKVPVKPATPMAPLHVQAFTELGLVRTAIDTELSHIDTLRRSITTNETEIAQLKKKNLIIICSILAAVLFVIFLIVKALG